MQLALLADRMSDLALELTDPNHDELQRVAVGDELIREIESDYGTFEDYAALTDSLALGMRMLITQNHVIPPRTGDFEYTDTAMARLSTVFTVLGEQLAKLADRSRTQQEKDLVEAYLTQHGIYDFYDDLVKDIQGHDLTAMATFVEKVAENAGSQLETNGSTATGQGGPPLDIPLAKLAQFYLAAGHRLDELTEYSMPPLN